MTATGRALDPDGADLGAQLAEALARVEQLDRALRTRDVIATAKGLLMAREGLTAAAAFDLLRRASQRQNKRVSDVATRLVEAHEARARRP